MNTNQIIHVDMDAFFAAIEQRDRPETRGRPLLVGGKKRGVVAAASYEARKFGIHSAMPMHQALRRCPHAVVVPPNRARYLEASQQIFAVFREYTPLVQGLSVDEAFLDVTGSRRLFGDAVTIATSIKQRILERTALTSSAGIASSKFVAKIASDLDKPNGLVIVPEEQAQAFLAPLPIEKMWGIGPKSASQLRKAGYRTFADLATEEPKRLEHVIGKRAADLQALARGLDNRAVISEHVAKSISAERTFEHDLSQIDDITPHLLAQCAEIARRLVHLGMQAHVLRVKVKYGDFRTKGKQQRLEEATYSRDTFFKVAKPLLSRLLGEGPAIRLVGVGVNDFEDPSASLSLFPNPETARLKRLEHIETALQDRFGTHHLTRASLLDS